MASTWECCPRHFLRRALDALHATAGLRLLAAFEQEFVYTGVEDRPGSPYALDLFRRQGSFGEALISAIRQAGVTPELVPSGIRAAAIRGDRRAGIRATRR